MPARPPLRRSFSDESGPGTFHSLGVLQERTRDSSPSKSFVIHVTHSETGDNRDSTLNGLSPCPTLPLRPQLSRGASAPILSGGKPLRSALKSSRTHHRTRSEPPTIKHVHFPEKDDALATIRVYHRSTHSNALWNTTNGNNNVTDTHAHFPSSVLHYEVDPTKSSPIPSNPSPFAYVLLEALNLPSYSSTGTTTIPLLTGSVLVRNLAFAKEVAIRFTLDDWQTVDETSAHYVDSLSVLPSQMLPSQSSPTTSDTIHQRGKGWDRFAFKIRLVGTHWFNCSISLAARYRIDSTYPEPGSSEYGPGNEWWDNNGGKNYCVGFRPAIATPRSFRSIPRPGTTSASASSPHTQPSRTCVNERVSDGNEERRSTLHHIKDFNPCNYVAPRNCTSSVLYTSTSFLPPLAALRPSTEEDSASPASSTLSTPTGSPTMVPCVVIDGLSTTSTHSSHEDDAITSGKGPIVGLDWAAPTNLTIERISCRQVGLMSGSGLLQRQHSIPLPHDSTSLHATLVSKWCYAQGPTHHAYDGGGMMV